jgi:holliday junction DNA helicase RuvB
MRALVRIDRLLALETKFFGVSSVTCVAINRRTDNPRNMSRAEITTPEIIPDESVVELSLRPQRLSEFIGQDRVKESLRIYIDAAVSRREPLDHTLFFGPPGLGKTTLAELIAREMGVNIRTTSGPALEKPGDLVGTLTNLREGDILFIDEIHRLKPIIEEFLYPAMEDYKIDIRLSEGPKSQTITMPIEKFTLIGATTRLGMLTPPMRARFGIEQRLNFYPAGDLEQIVHRTAEVMQVEIDEEGAKEIAKRSRGTPRVANRLLRRIRDFAQVRAGGNINRKVAADALQLLEVDQFGLDDMDSRILKTIIEKFDGGPVGVSTIAAAVGEDAGTLEEVYEPFLVQNGFLQRTPRGRVATAQAYRHFGFNPPSANNSAQQPTLF